MQTCIDEKQLLELTYGTASDELKRAAEDHADTCERCRELLDSATERITWTGDEMRPSDPASAPQVPVVASLGVVVPKKQPLIHAAKLDPKALVDALRSAGYPARPTRGTAIGRYLVIDALVENKTETVYSAYDPEEDRKVVLRLIHVAADKNIDDEVTRFERILRPIMQLRHWNVVPVYDVTREHDRILIVTEFVRGGTLAKWLVEKQRPWRGVLARFVEIGWGLEAAHKESVAHGKFGLHEVFLSERGQARVADIGLARAKRIAAETNSPQDDQFRFCVALYEALYGQAPFVEGSKEPRTPPAVKDLPKRVERAILRGLSATPEERFPSMTELVAQIDIWRRKPISKWWVIASIVSFLSLVIVAQVLGRRELARVARGTCSVAFESQSTPRVDPVQMRLSDEENGRREIEMNGCKLVLERLPHERHGSVRYRILPGSVCDWNLPTYGQRKFSIGEVVAVSRDVPLPAEEPHVVMTDHEIRVVFDVPVPEGPIWFRCHAVR